MPLSRPSVLAVVVALALGAAAAACGTASPAATPPTSTTSTSLAPTTTSSAPTTTFPPLTTTTAPPVPVAPQPSASDAAAALVNAWASRNQARALSVATAQSVATLFAKTYPGDLAISRGCSTSFPPLTCTYGPPGGGPTNAPIYQIQVSQAPSGGWYVSNVNIES